MSIIRQLIMELSAEEYQNQDVVPARTWPIRLAGLGILVFCGGLFAALVTYVHGEMGWDFLNPTGGEAAEAALCTNALGVVGLYVAGVLYWLLGAVAIYAVCLLALVALGMLWHPLRGRVGQGIALCCMVIFSCAILSIQPWILQEWAMAHGGVTPGGKLGYLDGICVAEALLGARWALCALLAAHAICCIYFGGFTLVSFGRGVVQDAAHCWNCWRRHRELRLQRKEREREEWMKKIKEREERAAADAAAAAAEAEANAAAEFAATEARLASMRTETPYSRAKAAPQPQHQQTQLPPRMRSGVQPRRQPLIQELPSEDMYATDEEMKTSSPPLQQRPAVLPVPPRRPERPMPAAQPSPARAATAPQAAAPEPKPQAQAPGRQYARHRDRNNLLDLMAPLEEEIALKNAPGADYEEEEEATPHRRGGDRRRPMRGEEESHRKRISVPAPAPSRPAPRTLPSEDTRVQFEDYPLPPYDLLEYKPVPPELLAAAQTEMQEVQQRIIDTLDTFRIAVEPGDITRGPSITRYEFYPPKGLRVNRIATLDRDIMLATSSKSVNILAPIPGKNTVGIELENAQKSPVYLRELLQSPNFNNPKLRIPVALGKDVYGNAVIGDLAAMPHTLVAGTTGSGKSVCINSMILSMLYKFRPEELRLILVDPKVVEMQPYKKLPHLACPVVTNPARVIGALRWAVNEMEHRYKMFSQVGVRNFEDFNNREDDGPALYEEEQETPEDDSFDVEAWATEIERQGEEEVELGEETQDEFDFDEPERIPSKLPYVVIIIDELADLMQVVKEDLENYIARLTQKARAAGIHLVAATQTPRANVVTGLIKANIPSRIAFRVASPLDSRIILDTTGAENLLGKGDSLFLPPGGITKMTRVQGAFVSDAEIASIIQWCASHAKQNFEQGVTAEMDNSDGSAPNADNGGRIGNKNMSDEDSELYTRCVRLVVSERKASTSLLQRRFSIGYGRAAKIMDQMEKNGIIAPSNGTSRPREVLVDPVE